MAQDLDLTKITHPRLLMSVLAHYKKGARVSHYYDTDIALTDALHTCIDGFSYADYANTRIGTLYKACEDVLVQT